MLSTGIVADELFLQHRTPPGHPERVERLAVLLEMLRALPADRFPRLAPRPATREELAWNHAPAHIQRVADSAGEDFTAFDLETSASARSYDAACLAAGGLLALLDAVLADRVRNGFAFVRPPGHHAEYDQAMGFCLFNNAAIGAHYLRRRHGLARVLVLDWDVHHGNGTEHSFYADPHVLYVSLHQWPHYPGTGAAEDVGSGPGEGYTVNLPLPAGCGDEAYLQAYQQVIDPIVAQFAPEFVLVSAGFDAHRRDPLSGMQLSEAGFAALTRCVLCAAERSAHGRVAVVLEGGYDLTALQASSAAVLEALNAPAAAAAVSGGEPPVLARVRAIQGRYWSL